MDLMAEFKKGAAQLTPSEEAEIERESLARSSHVSSSSSRKSHAHPLLSGTTSSSSPGPPASPAHEASAAMVAFFSDVELVKRHILAIHEAAGAIIHINQAYSTAATSDAETKLTERSNQVVTETSKRAQVAKKMLQHLREDNERMKTNSSSTTPNRPSELRIRENLTNTLTRKFVEVMKDYQNAQQQLKQDIKKKVTRHFRIVDPEVTTEQIDELISGGGGSGELFKKAILQGGADESLTNAFNVAKDKYHEVMVLERSVAELNQMFVDFATLIEQQGEMLDQIEYQVQHASDYIDEANVQMVQAVELQKSLRYKQCICFVIFLLIVGALAGIVYAFTKKD